MISAKEMKANALKAYYEGKLFAQNPSRDICFRDEEDYVCALGASMSFEEAETIYYELSVFENEDLANELQLAHDNWYAVAETDPTGYEAMRRKAKFLKLLTEETTT